MWFQAPLIGALRRIKFCDMSTSFSAEKQSSAFSVSRLVLEVGAATGNISFSFPFSRIPPFLAVCYNTALLTSLTFVADFAVIRISSFINGYLQAKAETWCLNMA